MSDLSAVIRNPVLRGFNPDPSILRVGGDYYIATSTFEWYPGVQIHHSRDLADWRLLTRPLTRASQLDLRGSEDSGGVWAPCLSHSDGLFWLVYSDVKRRSGAFKDSRNYLVTAENIEGPWSDPVFLNASGFDPSLFHDAGGRKYLLNMVWNHRAAHRKDTFGGILCQEYSAAQQRLVGPARVIWRGSGLGLTEGPHLYRRDGWYWLLTAEGGTGYDHAVTMARSRNLWGPYETGPGPHLLTAKDDPGWPLQRAGHGDIVETPAGDPYLVHLCARPLPGLRRSVCGRETAIQRLDWPAGEFPRLAQGGTLPAVEVAAPGLPPHPFPPGQGDIAFAPGPLPAALQWLRSPEPGRLFSLGARPGFLRLFGRESPGSRFEHAAVMHRQTEWCYDAETELEFAPAGYQQMAGLICWYHAHLFHYLAVTAGEAGGRELIVMSCEGTYPAGTLRYPLAAPLPLPGSGRVRLGVRVRHDRLAFRFAAGDGPWQDLPLTLDASLLADEAGRGGAGAFTGAFVGMAAHDIAGTATPADFAWFRYRPHGAQAV
ncbi:glycoside hydrolase family 43 protein [Poseidonocella sp. HB161398]|uniref:glycoside hydrolase family 43 protein n=1 Tax=Poseidonocella sp. HB161398 TaxID=2320855 RepID=UPI001F0F0FFE|nr:glycoside hydrolase family 43 protein [Poseidonocella sp. HB161398]